MLGLNDPRRSGTVANSKPATATTDYAIGLGKPSAYGQFFCWCPNGIRQLKVHQMFLLQPRTLLTPAQIKPKPFESRRNSFLSFLPGGRCVSWLCGCLAARLLLQSCISTRAFWSTLRGDKIECPISGVTKSGRVWRKVPKSDARRHELRRSTACTLAVHLQKSN